MWVVVGQCELGGAVVVGWVERCASGVQVDMWRGWSMWW